MLCRCVLYTDKSKKVVDLRCSKQTKNKDGVCDDCRQHRVQDAKDGGAYRGRMGLARRKSS